MTDTLGGADLEWETSKPGDIDAILGFGTKGITEMSGSTPGAPFLKNTEGRVRRSTINKTKTVSPRQAFHLIPPRLKTLLHLLSASIITNNDFLEKPIAIPVLAPGQLRLQRI